MIKKLFKRKDYAYENNKKRALNNDGIISTVYGTEPQSKQTKRFYFAHFILKYKIMLPLVWIFSKLFGKRLVKTTPDEPQFQYIKMFETAYDKSVIDWYKIYISTNNKKEYDEADVKEQYEKLSFGTPQFLRMMKEVFLTITTNDDSYMDFLPFFFNNIVYEMEKVKGKPHLLHTTGSTMTTSEEKVYLSITKQIKKGTLNYEIKPCGTQSKEGSKKL